MTRGDDDRLDRLRLARTPGVGPGGWRRLLARFGTATAALAALPGLVRGGGGRPLTVPARSDLTREIARLEAIGGRMVALGDADYPRRLAEIDDAPPVLTLVGSAHLFTRPAVALVGARNASLNARKLAEAMARDLAADGWLVVSGLARGIDGAAHQGALSAKGGATAAVLAGGVDVIYPPEHDDLWRRIAETGVLVAESPFGTEPTARLFPRRNRVISGLSAGVVVIEAAEHSGSLITARLAGEQGRDVLAVPGSPLDPRCRGSNGLLKQGAVLVEDARDVADALGRAARDAGEPSPDFAEGAGAGPVDLDDRGRAELRELLGPSPVAVDELLRRCHLSAGSIQVALLELELAGRLERLPGNRVALILDATPFDRQG